MAVIAALVLIGALAGLIFYGIRFRAEQRENKRVRAIFSRYVAPPIVEELLRRKDPHLYTGRAMQATIVVCRIWNFAGFAEELSPEETLRYLNEFFALAGTSIQKHRGMIDKFLADGIIGVFGVPLEDAQSEEHALNAALDIVRLVDAMDKRWTAQGRRSFQVGIGINSGLVIAGDAGFHERREFTVVGPETLFASSLQEATAELPAYVIASAATLKPVRHLFSVVPLNGHPLPGIKRLVDAFIVIGHINEPAPLRMPSSAAFKETAVAEEPADEPLPIARPIPQRVVRMSPEVVEAELLERLDDTQRPSRTRRRDAEAAADRAYIARERGRGRRLDHDDEPAFPDPPPPPASYESDGPPYRLS
jgi:class 3 adenylate cyclase